MKELPTPTFPFSQLGLRAALWPAPVRTPATVPVPAAPVTLPEAIDPAAAASA